MNKNYLIKLFKLTNKVLPEAINTLRRSNNSILASELAYLAGYLEALKEQENENQD